MKINFKIIFFMLSLHICYGGSQGVVYIDRYLGLLGNQLFQFCLGKILSKELGLPLKCPSIPGFPETYLYNNGSLLPDILTEKLVGHVINFKEICNNKSPRNIYLFGIFGRYEYFKEYKKEIKEWLRFDEPLKLQKNPNDIVMHVRIHPGVSLYLPPSYYEEALASTSFDNLYICTNEPNDPFLKNFERYNPIIKSSASLNDLMSLQNMSYEEIIKTNIEDFKFLMSFNKIIIAQSTFSWWAAFLSEASEVFAPLPKHGIMSSERPDVQLTGIEESRYRYIFCNNFRHAQLVPNKFEALFGLFEDDFY